MTAAPQARTTPPHPPHRAGPERRFLLAEIRRLHRDAGGTGAALRRAGGGHRHIAAPGGENAAGEKLADLRWEGGDAPADHAEALGVIVRGLDEALHGEPILAIGHRVVHGGTDFAAPMRIDDATWRRWRSWCRWRRCTSRTTWSASAPRRSISPACRRSPASTPPSTGPRLGGGDLRLAAALLREGIRRYGFHGLSYEYIARRIAAEDPELGAGRLVVAHLGNGASLCAIEGGRSRASTMGFTALDGIPMGTRSGQIDPGVILHMIDTLGMTTAEVTKLLYSGSGLKGMSGVSQDVRQIEAAGTVAAEHALEHFAFRVRREIGAMAASIGGIDALVFTAGIGENAQGMRARICAGLEFLGITLDPARNAANAAEISVAGAAVKVLVRRTDEEAMIAGHTLDVLRAG